MSSNQWQKQFSDALFSGFNMDIAQRFRGNNIEKRFSIYQNNVFFSLTQALADLYPVCKKLVGEDFFNGTANAYIRQYPPEQASMVNYGKQFPAFLQYFEHTQKLLWLADVAQLELNRHHSYHAADHPSLSAEDFAQIDHEKFANSRVKMHPSLTVLSSTYPIFSIWQANQQDNKNTDNIDLNTAELVITFRYNYTVQLMHVDPVIYNFYYHLLNSKTIAKSAELAIETTQSNNTANISEAINLGIKHGLFMTLYDFN